MKIAYFSAGTTGSGQLVRGIAIGNALRRRGAAAEYTIIHCTSFGGLCERFGFVQHRIPAPDPEPGTLTDAGRSTARAAVGQVSPDILIVDQSWFLFQPFLPGLCSRTVFITRQIHPDTFSVPLPRGRLAFRSEAWDLALAIEPFPAPVPLRQIDPIIIRNRDEILSRADAARELGIRIDGRNCLLAVNGHPGEFDRIRRSYAYLEEADFRMICSSNYEEGIFPAADYFNAFDLLVCGAGYNAFWEAVSFGKEALFVPAMRRFEDQRRRVETCRDYRPRANGADTLVELMLAL